MKKTAKYILILLAGILVLFCLLVLATQTSYVKERIKNEMLSSLQKRWNVQVEIEELEGNWYSDLAFKNVRLYTNETLAARIDLLHLQYSLLPLLNRQIEIDSVIIHKPEFFFKQINDSTWNWNSLASKKSVDVEKRKSSSKLSLTVQLDAFSVKNGSLNLESGISEVPQQINNFNLLAKGFYTKREQRVQLQHLQFVTQNPSIEVRKLSGECIKNEEGIKLDNLMLITTLSELGTRGKFENIENNFVNIKASKISNKELALFIPQFKLLCSPSVHGAVSTVNNKLNARFELKHNEESIKAELSLNDVDKLLNGSGEIPYTSSVQVSNFNINNWIETGENFNFPNGEMKFIGANLRNYKSFTNIEAHFLDAEFESFLMDSLAIRASYLEDSINAQINVFSEFGELDIRGSLNSFLNFPSYEAQVNCRHVDIQKIVPELIGTYANGVVELNGKGLKANEFESKARIMLTGSSVYTILIDSLSTEISIDASNLLIDTLQITVPNAYLYGNGTLNFDSLYLDATVRGDIDGVEMIDSIVELPIHFDSLSTTTFIRGPVKYLDIGGEVQLHKAEGYSAKVKDADAYYLVEVLEDSVNVRVDVNARQTELAEIMWDSTKVELNYAESKVDISANLSWPDTLQAAFKTSINLGDTMFFRIPEIEINTLRTKFYLPDTVFAGVYNYEKLALENFSLKDVNNPDFRLDANGVIANNEDMNFALNVNDFAIEKFNLFLNEEDSIKGVLASQISIAGSPQSPQINGELELTNPEIRNYSLSSFKSQFTYANQEGLLELSTTELGEALKARLGAKFDAYIDSLKLVFNPPETFDASLIIDSLDASQSFAVFLPGDSIKGILNGKLEAKGEWKSPQVFGRVQVVDGEYVNDDLGVEYKGIESTLNFDGTKVSLDTVMVRQKNGFISVSGELDFDSTMISGEITSSVLQVDANNFFLTQHRNYEILIDANTFVKSNNNKPEYGGKIKVLRSDVYLPAIIPDSKSDVDTDIPMLVEATTQAGDTTSASGAIKPGVATKGKMQSTFAKELTGRLNLEIPRNTWVRSNDMRAELSGELEIVKTGPYFEIFGNIDVTRGHYILYGRKLDIQESQLVFQGGQTMDPILNIRAEYIFRGSDKEKRYLQLLVNGEMSDPEITFLLDDSEITETDGVSILIFGVTSDEIGYGGQNSLINSVGSNAVASVITSQLSRTLGTQLKLDMIEVTATENWQSAAFVVGKYITNDIFVIYQRGFGEVDGDEITPENITIEYELNDKLFLRLMSGSSKESGVDVILKFEEGDKIGRWRKQKK